MLTGSSSCRTTQAKIKTDFLLKEIWGYYQTILLSPVLQCSFAQWNQDTPILNGMPSKPGLELPWSCACFQAMTYYFVFHRSGASFCGFVLGLDSFFPLDKLAMEVLMISWCMFKSKYFSQTNTAKFNINRTQFLMVYRCEI